MRYRLRDIQTQAIAAPPEKFNPNDFNLDTGWIIEYETDNPAKPWDIYRQPTSLEILEKIRADIAEARNWLDSADDRLDILERML